MAESRVILLRGVNVGGNNLVPMAKLRAFLETMGFTGVRTLLQSGNAVVRGGRGDDAAVERRLERDAAKHLGLTPEFFARSGRQLEALIAENPFPKAAEADPGRLLVFFFKEIVAIPKVRALGGSFKGPETFASAGRHLYVVYPEGMGRSKLTSMLLERTLGGRGTARNWNTVRKLVELCRGS
ncbi:MAG TPA: DUF1697 domain-containing protein [Vicinamibacterales bacterium]|jgi:uncharacterized protein (DUF1697 family)